MTSKNQYLTIETDDLVRSALRALPDQVTAGYQMRQFGKSRGKHVVEIKLPSMTMQDPTGSTIIPKLMITNSYDGTCALRVNFGFFRMICTNGMTVPAYEGSAIGRRIVHKQYNADRVKELEYEIAAQYQNLIEMSAYLTKLAATPVTPTQAVAAVATLGLSKRLTENITEAVNLPSRPEDTVTNLYALWNVVNEQQRLVGRSEFAQIQKNETLLTRIQLALAA